MHTSGGGSGGSGGAGGGGGYNFALSAPPVNVSKILANVEEQPLATIDEATRLRYEGIKADQGMKKWYGRSLLIGLGVQILIADAIFILYAAIGVQWKIGEPIMGAWLGATVIEVVGIVTIVVQHFFPKRSGGE